METGDVTSWFWYVFDAVVVTVPEVGADWMILTGVTVRVKVHVPAPPETASVPLTVYEPAGRGPLVLTAPVELTNTWVEQICCIEVSGVSNHGGNAKVPIDNPPAVCNRSATARQRVST